MTGRRMFASDPNYEAFNELWTMNAIIKNPRMFSNQDDLFDTDIQEIDQVLQDAMT